MRDYILFVDTETSGLPKNWNASYSEMDKWPFIVQVAWVIFDKQGREIKSEMHYIKATDYSINPDSREIHGISEPMTLEKGNDRKKVMKKIHKDLMAYKPLIVGHFIELDSHMLSVGFRRVGLKNIVKDFPKFCTMTATSSYRKFHNTQYPKLDELYQSLFKKKLENHHDALADARATAACFFELVKRGEVNDTVIKKQQILFKKSKKGYSKTGCGLHMVLLCVLMLMSVLLLAL